MTIEQIRSYISTITEVSVPITLNSRLSTTLGRVIFKGGVSIAIEFSSSFAEHQPEELIRQVILHELAHYVASIRKGVMVGHDAYFRQVCAELGCVEDRSRTKTAIIQPKAKYEILCGGCGKVVSTRQKKCKVTENPENYTNPCCSASRLEVKCLY